MDPIAAATRQRDDQWGSVSDRAAGARAESLLLDTHTCLPGIIKSFDAATQTATVQAAIKRQFILDDDSDGWVELPLCVDVPVHFPAGGGFVLTFPVADGDECLVVFSERAIDFWWDRGGVQEPSEYRLHDLSDAFAIVGFSSRPRAIPAVATDATELRARDGSLVLRIDGDFVTAGGVAGSQLAALGETLQTYLDNIATLLAAHVHTSATPGAPTSPSPTLISPALTPPTVTATRVKVL